MKKMVATEELTFAFDKQKTYLAVLSIFFIASFGFVISSYANSGLHYSVMYLAELITLITGCSIASLITQSKIKLIAPVLVSLVMSAFFIYGAYATIDTMAIGYETTLNSAIMYALHPIVIGVVMTGLFALATRNKENA